MGFWDSVVDFAEKWQAAGEVVDSLNDLPPTYKNSNDDEYYNQFIPDPVTEEGVQRALDRANEAQEKFDELQNKEKN